MLADTILSLSVSTVSPHDQLDQPIKIQNLSMLSDQNLFQEQTTYNMSKYCVFWNPQSQ